MVATIGAALIFVPLIRTPTFFSLAATIYGADDVHRRIGLSDSDIENILNVISEHDAFGRYSEYPSSISVVDYLLRYDSFGLIAIGLRPIGADFENICP